MRWTRVVAALLALLVMMACTQSEVDPNADIEIVGSVERQNGRPVANARVSLTKGADLGFGLAVFGTMGLACLAEETKVPVCGGARVVETDEQGRYAIDLKGRDTQGTVGNASTLEMSSVLPRGRREVEGPGTTVRFQVQTERLRIPLRFWEPRVEARIRSEQASVRWSRIPSSILPKDVSVASLRTDVRFARGSDETVWILGDVHSGARFDARILEDTDGNVAVTAEARSIDVRDELGREIDVVLRSGRYPYRGTGVAPFSRGAPCSYRGSGSEPIDRSPCPLTDGRWSEPDIVRPTADCSPEGGCGDVPTTAVLHFDEATPVDLVVVRGCDGCSVDVRRNGRWVEVGAGADGERDFVVNPRGRPSTNALRVRSSVAVDDLRELSVWSGRERAVEAGSFLRGVREDEIAPADRASRGWLPIVAGGLLALTLIGLGVVSARRRRAAIAA